MPYMKIDCKGGNFKKYISKPELFYLTLSMVLLLNTKTSPPEQY